MIELMLGLAYTVPVAIFLAASVACTRKRKLPSLALMSRLSIIWTILICLLVVGHAVVAKSPLDAGDKALTHRLQEAIRN